MKRKLNILFTCVFVLLLLFVVYFILSYDSEHIINLNRTEATDISLNDFKDKEIKINREKLLNPKISISDGVTTNDSQYVIELEDNLYSQYSSKGRVMSYSGINKYEEIYKIEDDSIIINELASNGRYFAWRASNESDTFIILYDSRDKSFVKIDPNNIGLDVLLISMDKDYLVYKKYNEIVSYHLETGNIEVLSDEAKSKNTFERPEINENCIAYTRKNNLIYKT